MGARYYASTMACFLSADLPFIDQHPGNPQTWNLYAYARNNPLRFTDPTGNVSEDMQKPNPVLPYESGGAMNSMGNSTCMACGLWEMKADLAEAFAPFDAFRKMQQQVGRRQDFSIEVSQVSGPKTADGQMSVQSGAFSVVSLTTSETLAAGTATLAVSLFDQRGNEHARGKLLVGVEGGVQHVSVRIEGQPVSGIGTVVNTRFVAVDPKNNFGFSGRGSLKFTISDAAGRTGTGRLPVIVSRPKGVAAPAHSPGNLRRDRTNFQVPLVR